jgi:hypothetical protein
MFKSYMLYSFNENLVEIQNGNFTFFIYIYDFIDSLSTAPLYILQHSQDNVKPNFMECAHQGIEHF